MSRRTINLKVTRGKTTDHAFKELCAVAHFVPYANGDLETAQTSQQRVPKVHTEELRRTSLRAFTLALNPSS